MRNIFLGLLFSLGIGLVACGGEEPSELETTEDAICAEPRCCGDPCCLKGGSWRDVKGLRMCCITDSGGTTICVTDPDAVKNERPQPPPPPPPPYNWNPPTGGGGLWH